MNIHPQVPVSYGDQTANVDEGIADLILALWRAEYRTESSCQAFPPAIDRAYVAFMTLADASRFHALMGEESDLIEATVEDSRGASSGDWSDDTVAAVTFPPSSIAEATRRVAEQRRRASRS